MERTMIRMLCTVLLITGCATYETVRDADGEVYKCYAIDDSTKELCFFEDSEDELRDSLIANGWYATRCELTGRWFPWITNLIGKGCRYSCTATTPGCNAKQGCYCPM